MSSELKKQKLFPEFEVEEFIGGDSNSHFEFCPEKTSSPFHVSENWWTALMADPSVAQYIDQRVQQGVEERISSDVSSLREEKLKEGREEGFRQGFEEGRDAAQRGKSQLDEICDRLVSERETLLRSHEVVWCRAFSQLLKKFLVPGRAVIMKELEGWITENIERFAKEGKLLIHLSSRDFDEWSKLLPSETAKRWEWVRDSSLNQGEFYCEAPEGGFFFSEPEAGKKLDWLIENVVQKAAACS